MPRRAIAASSTSAAAGAGGIEVRITQFNGLTIGTKNEVPTELHGGPDVLGLSIFVWLSKNAPVTFLDYSYHTTSGSNLASSEIYVPLYVGKGVPNMSNAIEVIAEFTTVNSNGIAQFDSCRKSSNWRFRPKESLIFFRA
jgi:hypothetical protein